MAAAYIVPRPMPTPLVRDRGPTRSCLEQLARLVEGLDQVLDDGADRQVLAA